MNAAQPPRPVNPLERAANAIPVGLASTVTIVMMLAGVALALFVAFDESYDETQVFAVSVAIIGLLTLAPVRGKLAGAYSVAGGAVLLYAGALLFNVSIGPALLVAGVLATAAALVTNHHRRGSPGVAVTALFGAMVATTALVLAIVFAVGS